jgi:uncharacterized RDD family membrane protein YckC
MKFDLQDQTEQDAAETAADWAWPEASPGQRLIAFVIDAVLLTALGGFMEAAARRAGISMYDHGKSLLGLAYFLIMHARFGQTLGKKVVGIRVVDIAGTNQSGGLSLRVVLMRDFLGQIVNVFTFLLGYLLILFRSDRRGIHDMVGGTRVIALEDAKVIHFRYVAASGLVLLLVAAGTAYHMAYHTAWPLKKAIEHMELDGWTAEGVTGSFGSGYGIAKLTRSTSEGSVEINGLHFHYDPFGVDKNNQSSFVIRRLGVESATLEIRKWPGTDRLSSVGGDSGGEDGKNRKPSEGSRRASSKSFSIESLDLQQLRLKLPDDLTREVSRVFVSGLVVAPEKQEISLERVYIASDWIDLDLQEIAGSLLHGELEMKKPAMLVLKPGLHPELIKSAIDVQLQAEFKAAKLERLDLSAFRKRMSVRWEGESGDLSISSWTPQHYFHLKAPLWAMDFKIAGNPMKMQFSGMEGSVGLRQHRFALSGSVFVHERSGRTYFMLPKLGNWRGILSGEEAVMTLTSQHRQSARDVLAEIYFGKSLEGLLPQELAHVEGDMQHFADVMSPQKGPQLDPVVQVRSPSSEKNDPKTPSPASAAETKPLETKSRLPQALPQKKQSRRGLKGTGSADRFSR